MSSRIALFTLLLFVLSILLVTPVRAENIQPQSSPEVVKVGIYLIRASGLDISTGGIDVDFYIDFVCEQLCDKKQDKFELINGTIKSSVLTEEDPTNPTYRVNATVFQRIDLKHYPFDNHDIKIIIESAGYQTKDVIYAINPDTTVIDPQVFILGWDLAPKPVAEISEKYYEAWGLTYSRYTFNAHLSKPALASWLKGILPAVFILLGSLLALFITAQNISSRVAIITSSLVASVLYHLNFTQRVPAIGYLTFADTFMIVNYIVLLISLALTIWMLRAANMDRKELIERINKVEIIVIPALWLLLHIANYMWVF